MAVLPSHFAPRTVADAERIMQAGSRDMKRAANYLGISQTDLWSIVSRGLVWSFKRGKRRLVPVVELRRYGAIMAIVAEGLDVEVVDAR